MAGSTVRVFGARETARAFRQIDRQLATNFGNDLKNAAAPVVSSAKGKVSRYQGASIGTIRAKRAGARVYVEQSAKKVTGDRADFGALQMRTVLIPALDENADEVFNEVEHVLNRYAAEGGF
jgi:hypothetical protein